MDRKILALLLILAHGASAAFEFDWIQPAGNELTREDEQQPASFSVLLRNCFSCFGDRARGLPSSCDARGLTPALSSTLLREIAKLLETFVGVDNRNKVRDNFSQAEIIAYDILRLYKLVSYHNVCHGLAVGLYALTIARATPADNDGTHGGLSHAQLMGSALVAGLFHDIGHTGMSDATWKEDPLRDFGQSHNIWIAEFNGQANTSAPIVPHADNKYLTDVISLVGTGNTVQEKLTAMIVQPTVLLKDLADNNLQNDKEQPAPVLAVVLKSAEFFHATVAYHYLAKMLADRGDKFNLAFAIKSILKTNMGLEFTGWKTKNDDASKRLDIVHAADLLGNASLDDDLRVTMVTELMYEFAMECLYTGKPHPAGIKLQLREQVGAGQPKVLRTIEADHATFANGQKGFLYSADSPFNIYHFIGLTAAVGEMRVPKFAVGNGADQTINFGARLQALTARFDIAQLGGVANKLTFPAGQAPSHDNGFTEYIGTQTLVQHAYMKRYSGGFFAAPTPAVQLRAYPPQEHRLV